MTWEEAYLKDAKQRWTGRRCWWIPCAIYTVTIPDTLDVWQYCPKCGFHQKIRDGVQEEIAQLQAIFSGWVGQGLWWPRNKEVQKMAEAAGLKKCEPSTKAYREAAKGMAKIEADRPALDEATAMQYGWNPNQ